MSSESFQERNGLSRAFADVASSTPGSELGKATSQTTGQTAPGRSCRADSRVAES